MMVIKFYKVNEDYGEFSNFASYPIFLDNKNWPTVEHYFQASKFIDTSLKDKIRQLKSPFNAAEEGRNMNNPLRSDWDVIKLDVMEKALKAKFRQHPSLTKLLLETENALIVESTKNDSYWADGGDGTGQNQLGKLLMRIRDEVKVLVNDNLDVLLPPWLAFPDIAYQDMFWRMGIGESFLSTWSRYYLSLKNKEEYQKNYPTPVDWQGFYS